ncbi:GntR family transcriptional regulator [uncultured Cloacibacillus sp.]|uniref:GntR family transcriptional regulator n=1 Tax=uncultured Cloacibacillus sp. TaxID=889794 RepID=UPI0025DE9DCC|nr:GntR family transcriptional regulator [uncultured Cloacibacillus sp.]
MKKPKTLTELVYEDIKRDILSGGISPGSKISLEDTASRLDVSLTPVREALTKLQQEGIVQYIPRAGWRASKLSKKTYLKYRELQMVLELTLTELALPHVTDETIDKMDAANQKLQYCIDHLPQEELPQALLQINDSIHMMLFSCYDNEIMTKALQNVWNMMGYYRLVLFGTPYFREIGYKDHAQLIAALREKDAQAVYKAMEQHLVNGPLCLEDVFCEDE